MVASADAKRYTILANPFLVITGFANWLWDVQASARVPRQFGAPALARAVARADLPGQDYLWIMLATCAAAIGLLWMRFRRTEV